VYQIRTILCICKSGFYVVKCDGFRTIFVVECDDQLVIVEINPVDKRIDEPLPVRLLAHIQDTEFVQETVFFRIWRTICPACQFSSFLSAIIYLVFSVEIIEKEILASNAFVATNAKKCPNRYLRSRHFSSLLRLRPNPRRTQNVF